jgi:hypothetical protein
MTAPAVAALTRPAVTGLPMHPHAPLVALDTVIAARGQDADTITGHADKGVLRWVFNVAVNPGGTVRELRFWTREVALYAARQGDGHEALRSSNAGMVIAEILGDRKHYRPGEVCLLLGIRRPTLLSLRRQLPRCGNYSKFPRATLEKFLKRRLVG